MTQPFRRYIEVVGDDILVHELKFRYLEAAHCLISQILESEQAQAFKVISHTVFRFLQIVQTTQNTAKAEQQMQVLLVKFQAAMKSIAQSFKQELVSGQFGWLDVMKDNSLKAYLHCLTATYT